MKIGRMFNLIEDNIHQITQGKTNQVCIFGTGVIGKKMFLSFRKQGIFVDCFSNNQTKELFFLSNGYCCLPLEQLLESKNNTLVIVAIKEGQEVIDQLKRLEVPFVFSYEQVTEWVEKHPSSYYRKKQDVFGKIAYNTPEIEQLISKFHQVLLEMDHFYQEENL